MEIDSSNITLDDIELIEKETIEIPNIDVPMLRGLSAYALAVKNGYVGTEQEWLASLKGEKGDTGSTNYTDLSDKPSINSIELTGNKTSDELDLQEKITDINYTEINNLF